MHDLEDLIHKITSEEHKRVETWLEFCGVTKNNANEFWLGIDRNDYVTIYRLYRIDILVGSFEFSYSIEHGRYIKEY